MIIDGNWMILEGKDPVPAALLYAQERSNLCLRCGMRIWSSDITIHDGWHKWLEAQLNAKVDNVQHRR